MMYVSHLLFLSPIIIALAHTYVYRALFSSHFRFPWCWWATNVTWQNRESSRRSRETSSPASLEGVHSSRPPPRTRSMWSKSSMTSSVKSTARTLGQQTRKRRKVVVASYCRGTSSPIESSLCARHCGITLSPLKLY
jgi:hypothetical protein